MSSPEFQPGTPHNPPVIGGHMLYDKHFEYDPELRITMFVKAFDLSLLTIPSKANGMRRELAYEAAAYEMLRAQHFEDIPEYVAYADDTLRIQAYRPEDGWEWDVPEDPTQGVHYANDILDSLSRLEAVPPMPTHHESSTTLFLEQGWPRLFTPDVQKAVLARIDDFAPYLHPQTVPGAEKLADVLVSNNTELADTSVEAAKRPHTQLGHFDARPSNIGWHPTDGVRIVDWSWAANTSPHSDSTMFLIDTHKTGFETRDLASFHDDFDRSHAALFIGYWLARCIAPGPDQNVRFHQFASAATAASIIL